MRLLTAAALLAAAFSASAPAMAQYDYYGSNPGPGSQRWSGGPVGPYGQQMYTSPGPDGGRISGGPTPGGGEMYTYTPNRNSAGDCATSAACGFGLGYDPTGRN